MLTDLRNVASFVASTPEAAGWEAFVALRDHTVGMQRALPPETDGVEERMFKDRRLLPLSVGKTSLADYDATPKQLFAVTPEQGMRVRKAAESFDLNLGPCPFMPLWRLSCAVEAHRAQYGGIYTTWIESVDKTLALDLLNTYRVVGMDQLCHALRAGRTTPRTI